MTVNNNDKLPDTPVPVMVVAFVRLHPENKLHYHTSTMIMFWPGWQIKKKLWRMALLVDMYVIQRYRKMVW